MAATGFPGPISVEGLKPLVQGPVQPLGLGAPATLGLNTNIDAGPSLFWSGTGVRDPRWLQRIGAGSNQGGSYLNQDLGWFMCILLAMDAAPAAAAAGNLVPAANVTNGTPMARAGASAGITLVPAGGIVVLPAQTTIPAGSLVIDGLPQYQGGEFGLVDPARSIARAVSITGVAAGTGGHFLVRGADIYGELMTEDINATAGATTTVGPKAFKFIISVTPQFTDAHTYSVQTTDLIGFPLRVDTFSYVDLAYANARITANTGFTAAVATDPATAITGDVRGTYTLQSASNGTNAIQMWIKGSVANLVSNSTFLTFRKGLLGMPQFSS
jgi:hypothetical protein